ncbi:MAG: hypothetical protein B1H40_02065, partial [Candidatus Latescibacteria bacterium 4484_181]
KSIGETRLKKMRTLSSGRTAVTAKVNIGEPVRIYRQMPRQYEPLGSAIRALYDIAYLGDERK